MSLLFPFVVVVCYELMSLTAVTSVVLLCLLLWLTSNGFDVPEANRWVGLACRSCSPAVADRVVATSTVTYVCWSAKVLQSVTSSYKNHFQQLSGCLRK